MQSNKLPIKTALITGANRGIGLEIARQLSEQGVHVFMAGRNHEELCAKAHELQASGYSVSPLKMDINSEKSINEAFVNVSEISSSLDILVNNAAVRVEKYGKKPTEQSLCDWRSTFETNLFGTICVTQKFLPLILASSSGRIVNVSSLLGSVATHNNPESYAYTDIFKSLPAYSASKSAINSWTVHLAYQLRNTPIKVNAVHPGYTKTELNDGEGEYEPSFGAKSSVSMALLDEYGPSGSFVHMDKPIPW